MYAIVDIETTGISPKAEKITEIAIYIHNGEKITDEYVTLINPERNIPYFITNLTGITNEMVENAPCFFEAAKKIVEITEGCTFVAHNARFDYSFLQHEFKSLGFNFKRNILDTVALSRKLLPGHQSYSLGNICSKLNISINGRHRAAGDAFATTKLFEILLERDKTLNKGRFLLNQNKKTAELNPNLNLKKIEEIPNEPGIYYFYNDNGDLIYIGKSRNLMQRIHTHLFNNSTQKTMEMRYHIADIDWELTGSELIALLKESEEIKANKPHYNKAAKVTEELLFKSKNFFIIDAGRSDDEKCAVKIADGKYKGYGYFDINDMSFGLATVHECIKPATDNGSAQVILKRYLKNNKVEKIIEF